MGEQVLGRPEAVSAFLDSIAPFVDHMVPSLSYLAFRRDDAWHIFRARVNYNFANYAREPLEVRTANIIAGTRIVEGGIAGARGIIDEILAGKLVVGEDRFLFPPQHGGAYAATHVPLLPEGVERQYRMGLLQIRGSDQYGYTNHSPFDWELRAAETPFDGGGELLTALNIAHLPEPASLFEAMVFQVAAIDGASTVHGTKARLGISLAPTLDHAKASVGYRVISGGNVVARSRIVGTDLQWTTETARELAWAEIDVPPAAVVQAFACYAGVAYQHWWFNDPQHSQNPRRAAFAKIDPGLTTLESFLGEQSKQARDLEFAVSWLLWMLGFSPAHLGANQKMSDAADILVATPQGHFAVVECTTGVLKSGHKLSLLAERAESLREALRLSNSQHLRVLPVMVTTRGQEEVRAELDDARKAGIVVITRDDLPDLVARTLLMPNAEEAYTEAEQSLRETDLVVPAEPQFPFNN